MRFQKFKYTVGAMVLFTGADLVKLYEHAVAHYDVQCQNDASGWIYQLMAVFVFRRGLAPKTMSLSASMEICRENPTLEIEEFVTSRRLDRMMKILQDESLPLKAEVRRVFAQIQAESHRVEER